MKLSLSVARSPSRAAMKSAKLSSMPQSRQGIIFASVALLLWSTSSAMTVWTGAQIGPWQFLALTASIAGVAQLFIYRRLRMPYRRILFPPPKLFVLILTTFVLYMVVCTLALVLATKPQKVGVNLANFLWPTLTIVFAVVLIPGSRMSVRLLIALFLALAGVFLANLQGLRELVSGGNAHLSPLPYVLGLMAGITWGLYSVMLAKWKNWANRYATSTPGFLLTAAVAFAVCVGTKSWSSMSAGSWIGVIYMALGPQAAAYLLWEMALHRAPTHTLGLLASGNAVVSTLWLFVIIPFVAGKGAPPNYWHCLLAAACIAVAVLVGNSRGAGEEAVVMLDNAR